MVATAVRKRNVMSTLNASAFSEQQDIHATKSHSDSQHSVGRTAERSMRVKTEGLSTHNLTYTSKRKAPA
eukprot:c7725_g1_i1 orf=208-417(+)